jgi:hypothetical protein
MAGSGQGATPAGPSTPPDTTAAAILEELLRLMRDRQSRPANAPSEAEGHAIADYQVLSSLLRGSRGADAARLDTTEFTFDKGKHVIKLETSFGAAKADVHRRLTSSAGGLRTSIVRLEIVEGTTITTPNDTEEVPRVDLLGPDGEVKGWARLKK